MNLALERYADRFPASKAQTSAEFQGNPLLSPERSTQGDLWLEGSYPRVNVSLNAFARRMDDYITLTTTDLTPLLPLSPGAQPPGRFAKLGNFCKKYSIIS